MGGRTLACRAPEWREAQQQEWQHSSRQTGRKAGSQSVGSHSGPVFSVPCGGHHQARGNAVLSQGWATLCVRVCVFAQTQPKSVCVCARWSAVHL